MHGRYFVKFYFFRLPLYWGYAIIKSAKKWKGGFVLRRFLVILLSLTLILGLSITVFGENEASEITVSASVNPDESCQVTVIAVLNVDTHLGSLRFPVPIEATDVTLNGSRVKTEPDRQAQYIPLSDVFQSMVGQFTVTIGYRLPDVIEKSSTNTPQLQLPLLSGYEYPIEKMNFTVTLPGEIQAKPAFSSGYHKANIEKFLTCTQNGTTLTGSATEELKDHETLTMTLAVEESWFPNAPLEFFESNVDDVAMVICGIIALLYWVFSLRSIPPARRSGAMAPEGITAGQIGAVMTLGKADLSLMVFSWAKLGYIQIESGKRKVLLHKRMDMGNERSAFEQKCFRLLFGKKTVVNTAAPRYSACQRAVSKMSPGLQSLVNPRSGNPKLFRAMAASVALFAGVSFGIAITQEAVIQSVWIFLTASVGLFCGWFMQTPIRELFLRKSYKTAVGIVFTLIWLVMGFVCGQPVLCIVVMILQWLAGGMAFFCGRRTEAGRQDYARIMGLRHYLKTVSKERLEKLQEIDPDYFHTMAPLALAFGLSHTFARRFGKEHIPDCPYITTTLNKSNTAWQWSETMARTLWLMNRRNRLRPLEHWANRLPGGVNKP